MQMGLASPYLEGGEATGYLFHVLNKSKWEGPFWWGPKTQLATTSACSSPGQGWGVGGPGGTCFSLPCKPRHCSGLPLLTESPPESNIQIPAPFHWLQGPPFSPHRHFPDLSSKFPLCFACPSPWQFAHCDTVTAAHLHLALEDTGMTVALAKALKPSRQELNSFVVSRPLDPESAPLPFARYLWPMGQEQDLLY